MPERIILVLLPGVPTDAPKNISWRFQTPDVVEIVYDPPPEHARNGQVSMRDIAFLFYSIARTCNLGRYLTINPHSMFIKCPGDQV